MGQTLPISNSPRFFQKGHKFRDNVEMILIAVLLALFLRGFVIQAFRIPSASMEDTLQIGDFLLVNKFLYGTKVPFTNVVVIPGRDPRKGDIVVFSFPTVPNSKFIYSQKELTVFEMHAGQDFIKRIVGVPGDTIEVRDKVLYVNEERQAETYVQHRYNAIMPAYIGPRDNFGPYTVPPDMVFMMGDNREDSYDSRFWGPVKIENIKGKAFVIYFSWEQEKSMPRFSRLFHWIR